MPLECDIAWGRVHTVVMRSPFARIFFIAAIAFFVVWGVRMYKKLPPRPKAQFAMIRGDYKDAVQQWNHVLEQEPDNMEVILSMAECFDKMNDPSTAAQLYRAAESKLNDSHLQVGLRYHKTRYEELRNKGY